MERFSELTNDQVIDRLKRKVLEERETLIEILDLLFQVEKRRIYLERGFSSLFEFATVELAYSGAAAHRRIEAMRLRKSLPEVGSKIVCGAVNLSTIAKLTQFIRTKEKSDESKMPVDEKKEWLARIENKSARTTEQMFIAAAPELLPKQLERERPITPEFTELRLLVKKEFMQKLTRAKEFHAHVNPGASTTEIMEYLLDAYLKKKDPVARGLDRGAGAKQPEDESKSHAPSMKNLLPTRKRYVPLHIQRQVWARDQGQCTFADPLTNRRCSSRRALELDHHVTAFARGGEHTLDNLTLRCTQHNQLGAIRVFGEAKMSRYLNDMAPS